MLSKIVYLDSCLPSFFMLQRSLSRPAPSSLISVSAFPFFLFLFFRLNGGVVQMVMPYHRKCSSLNALNNLPQMKYFKGKGFRTVNGTQWNGPNRASRSEAFLERKHVFMSAMHKLGLDRMYWYRIPHSGLLQPTSYASRNWQGLHELIASWRIQDLFLMSWVVVKAFKQKPSICSRREMPMH